MVRSQLVYRGSLASMALSLLIALPSSAGRTVSEVEVADSPELREVVGQVNSCCSNAPGTAVDSSFVCSAARSGNESVSKCFEGLKKNADANFQEDTKKLKETLSAASMQALKECNKQNNAFVCADKKMKTAAEKNALAQYHGAFRVKDFVESAAARAQLNLREGRVGSNGIQHFSADSILKLNFGDMECPVENPTELKEGSRYDPRVLAASGKGVGQKSADDCVDCHKDSVNGAGEMLPSLSSLTPVQADEAFKKAVPQLEFDAQRHFTEVYGEHMLGSMYLYLGKDGVKKMLPKAAASMGCLKEDATTIFGQLTAKLPNYSDAQRALMRDTYHQRMTNAAQCRVSVADRVRALKETLGDMIDPSVTLSIRENALKMNQSEMRDLVDVGVAMMGVPLSDQQKQSAAEIAHRNVQESAEVAEMAVGFTPVGAAYSSIAATQGLGKLKGACNRYTAAFDSTQKAGGENAEFCKNAATELAILSGELSFLDRAYPVLARRDTKHGTVAQSITARIGLDPRATQYNANPANGKLESCMEQFRSDPKDLKSPMQLPDPAKVAVVAAVAEKLEVESLLAETKDISDRICSQSALAWFKKNVTPYAGPKTPMAAAMRTSLGNPGFLSSFYTCDRPQFAGLNGLGVEVGAIRQEEVPLALHEPKACTDRRSSGWVSCRLFDQNNRFDAQQANIGAFTSQGMTIASLGGATALGSATKGGLGALAKRMVAGGVFSTAIGLGSQAMGTDGEQQAAQASMTKANFMLGYESAAEYDKAIDTLARTPSFTKLAATSFAAGALNPFIIFSAENAIKGAHPQAQPALRKMSKAQRSFAMQAFAEIQKSGVVDPLRESRIYNYLAGETKVLSPEDAKFMQTQLDPIIQKNQIEFMEKYGQLYAELQKDGKLKGRTKKQADDLVFQKAKQDIDRLVSSQAKEDVELLAQYNKFPEEKGEFLEILSILKRKGCKVKEITAYYQKIGEACRTMVNGVMPQVPIPACAGG